MTTRAYAKINLGLRILGRRDDGYHEIETIFHRINLYDEITFEPASTISLACNHHELPTDERNLCVRAAGLLQKLFGIHEGVHITLKKTIPIGAGLGGGSADAAAVLVTLPKWWNQTLSTEEQFALALQLGADVPYFLQPGTAYATGKGEILHYIELDIPYWIVVVYPNLHISTAWAYQKVKIPNLKSQISNPKTQATLKEIILEHLHEPRMLMSLLHNDFEPLILRTYEPVARVKQALYIAGADFAQLSGSGSSVFGLFQNETYAKDAARELGKHYQVFITPPHFKAEM